MRETDNEEGDFSMNKILKLTEHLDIDIDFSTPKFFRAGDSFPPPDFKERIKSFSESNGKIVVKGDGYTICTIKAPKEKLEKIQLILKSHIGKEISVIENIEL
jgi:hypothetical protein